MVENSIVECDCPNWNNTEICYDYVESVKPHYIKEFVPIRCVIMSSRKVKITMNHFTVDQDGTFFNIAAVRL